MAETEANVIVGPEVERFIEGSLGELLLLLLKTHCDNIVQVDAATDEELPANLLLSRSIQVAKWLKSIGVKEGDSISVNSENRLEFAVVTVATFFIGAVFAPLNPEYTPGELNHVLKLSKPRVVFCSPQTIKNMTQVFAHHPNLTHLVLFGARKLNENYVTMHEDIIRGATPDNIDESFEATPVNPTEAVATILMSSGTTGLPKGVMCTHESMTIYVDIMRVTMAQIIENEDPSDAIMGLAPFFHSMGFMLMFLNLLRGKKMVVLSRFKTKIFLDAIIKYKISRLVVPPPVMLVLLKHPLTKQYDLSGVKEIRTGAAPMGKDMERELKERFKVGHVSQGYGMTETTLGILVSPLGKTKVGSVGKIVPGMMVKVIDENGRAVGPYKEGEVCFKGPLIMKGYVGDPVATANTIDQDGWIHTGDVAYYDNEGYFFIVDRIKELIKYKGYQVAPAELEALLITHPAVADAAVIGLPDERAGELPLAFVVKKPGHETSEKELEKFVADNVSSQKQLRGGVVFIDAIPRNPSGKILRRHLKQQAITLKSKL
ncbi:4-coumarate--CoA ligase 1-like [Tribolium madens]|uniref:4-coumarate--CoA ligase 1-like n=1 Tax=Tribolium madens TaxID=41895 RepID=UPI001CF72F28|nr:4-coumarate--CoA ligase 1-like [Tribolium madens]XP_044258007.1 4-coumarate--CoA ligase 1-like [Tribolium madens]